ncbi:MAG: hypothetical protein UW10_C0031G0003 [Candidatus Magasanikbacteria bacterium GW2011_GWA2_43_9]|nr:MAG: hypothetical protein UW10_C0031G0003 [Candidatus Magasanikbacteria bacterium GW2011_GWA2_43_9]
MSRIENLQALIFLLQKKTTHRELLFVPPDAVVENIVRDSFCCKKTTLH